MEMWDAVNTYEIIKTGKLKTYRFNSTFIQVYYTHPSVGRGFYIFTFYSSNKQFSHMVREYPRFIPVKQEPKKYQPIMERMMKDLYVDLEKQLAEYFDSLL